MKQIAVALMLALAACGQGETGPDEYPVIEAQDRNTSIGPNGAAGISEPLPLSIDAVNAAAPNFIVEETTGQIEGNTYRMITLSAADEVVFNIRPTSDGANIHAIDTRSTQARGPNGEIIGEAIFGDAPATESMFCLSEYIDGAPGFACSTAEDGRFWRVYVLPEGYDGPTEPFATINPDAALASTLAEMRWIAPRVE